MKYKHKINIKAKEKGEFAIAQYFFICVKMR